MVNILITTFPNPHKRALGNAFYSARMKVKYQTGVVLFQIISIREIIIVVRKHSLLRKPCQEEPGNFINNPYLKILHAFELIGGAKMHWNPIN